MPKLPTKIRSERCCVMFDKELLDVGNGYDLVNIFVYTVPSFGSRRRHQG